MPTGFKDEFLVNPTKKRTTIVQFNLCAHFGAPN
jgi:hypothetical protein